MVHLEVLPKLDPVQPSPKWHVLLNYRPKLSIRSETHPDNERNEILPIVQRM